MVAPGMLQNPAVKAWLGGIEPGWTLLDQQSFDALRRSPPSPSGERIEGQRFGERHFYRKTALFAPLLSSSLDFARRDHCFVAQNGL